MIDYKRWQKLHESFGFPLSIKSPDSLGLLGRLLDEKKQGKKMFGDGPDGSSGDDADLNIKVKKPPVDVDADSDGDDDMDKDNGDSGHNDDCDCDCHKKGSDMEMCKKCSKKMKKKMKKESFMDSFTQYPTEPENYEVGSKEYRDEFFKSLQRQFGDPNEKFSDGTPSSEPTFGEDMLVSSPADVIEAPQAGDVGFAPVSPVGQQQESRPTEAPRNSWDSSWVAYVEHRNS